MMSGEKVICRRVSDGVLINITVASPNWKKKSSLCKEDYMKDQVMQQLGFVLNALNNVYVKGKANLANLSGSIAILEEVADVLNNAEIVEATSKSAEK